MTIEVGPYRFTEHDARRTIANIDELLDFTGAAAQPALAGLRTELHDHIATGGEDDPAAAIAEVFPKVLGARSILESAGILPAPARGMVVQLNVSGGGVPKLPVDRVDVDHAGITTDTQATRQHHGRPWQAVCLWNRENIEALIADGHPIHPGAAGENITVAGLDWADVSAGVRLAIGSTLVQVTAPAVPCSQNARWFSDRRFDRIHHRHGPVSRVYAAVIEPGSIAVGDEVVLEPSD